MTVYEDIDDIEDSVLDKKSKKKIHKCRQTGKYKGRGKWNP